MANPGDAVIVFRAPAALVGLAVFVAVGCGDVTGVGIRPSIVDGGSARSGQDSGYSGDATGPGTCAAGCAGRTPVCDTSTGLCVECLVEAHCAGTGKGYCDLAAHRCSACLDSSNCLPGLVCDVAHSSCVSTCVTSADCGEQVCDVSHGYCVDCVSSNDCRQQDAPVCETRTGRCVQCVSMSDCPGAVCDTAVGACVECTSQIECPLGRACDLVTGRCEAKCTTDRECPGDRPFCEAATSVCVECLSTANCRDPALPVCSPVTHHCYACLSDSDCKDPANPVCLVRGHQCGGCASGSDCPNGLRCDVAGAQCL